MNDYSIERFKQHLVNALPLIDGEDNIDQLLLFISMEYDDLCRGDIECLADEEPTLNHLFGDSPTSSLTIRSK